MRIACHKQWSFEHYFAFSAISLALQHHNGRRWTCEQKLVYARIHDRYRGRIDVTEKGRGLTFTLNLTRLTADSTVTIQHLCFIACMPRYFINRRKFSMMLAKRRWLIACVPGTPSSWSRPGGFGGRGLQQCFLVSKYIQPSTVCVRGLSMFPVGEARDQAYSLVRFSTSTLHVTMSPVVFAVAFQSTAPLRPQFAEMMQHKCLIFRWIPHRLDLTPRRRSAARFSTITLARFQVK